MTREDKQAAIEVVGRSRSCAKCEYQPSVFCKVCYRESVRSFLKGIEHERKNNAKR